DSFEYSEILMFTRDEERLILHYEQRTWTKESATQRKRPSHWESGFLMFDENLAGTINCAQSGGRLELIKLNKLDFNGDVLILDFSPAERS
ncbi:MAG: heme-binding beta-barrel domain-containing protein, partial [Cyclobacteriaceae bacterium]